jgi:hypothetical protein
MVRNFLIFLCIVALAGCAGMGQYRPEETGASKPVSELPELLAPPDDSDQFFINDSGISKSLKAEYVVKMLETDRSIEIHPNNLPADGQKSASFLLFDDSEDVTTGDGAGDLFWRVPSILNGWNIVGVAAAHQTAGAGTGVQTTTVQIRNVTDSTDILSTRLTIDEDETDSSTATAAVINTSYDDLATGEQLRFDVDAVPSTTAPKGLLVELIFKKP